MALKKRKKEKIVNIFLRQKNCYTPSFSILGRHDSTRALQYSPFQILGGGPLSLTNGRKSLCLILDTSNTQTQTLCGVEKRRIIFQGNKKVILCL